HNWQRENCQRRRKKRALGNAFHKLSVNADLVLLSVLWPRRKETQAVKKCCGEDVAGGSGFCCRFFKSHSIFFLDNFFWGRWRATVLPQSASADQGSPAMHPQ